MSGSLAIVGLVPDGLSALPEEVTTRSGVKFDPNADTWLYRESALSVNMPFTSFSTMPCGILLGLKLTLIWFAKNRSPSYVKNLFERIKHFWGAIDKSSVERSGRISDVHILNYKATLSSSNEWYLKVVSLLFRKWHDLGHSGIDDSAIKVLKDMRLKSNLKGEAVQTMDSLNGPFTDIELESIQVALAGAHANGQLSNADYVLTWLFMLLGARPVQYAVMKVCDFRIEENSAGIREYCLRVPRAKQRHGKARLEFKDRLITPQIGTILEAYVDQIRADFRGIFSDLGDAPMFPLASAVQSPEGYEYHSTSGDVSMRLVKVFEGLNVISERTGKVLHVTPTRFRRTLGTRAAAEGHGEFIIAELLDHSDTSNVGVYVQSTPAIIERIDKAIALQMAPLAQAFAGVLIHSEKDARRGNEPSSRIFDPRIVKSMKPMGTCGSHSFCGQFAPIACYTCANFQPWLDGPHEEVLDYLIGERDKMLTAADKRIASVNDRTILAVAEVVRRCAATCIGMKEG